MSALQSTNAEETPLTRNTYGEIGILDMPNAHMAPDGQLAFNFGAIEKTQRFSINFQALPWLEASFRYSHFAPGSQNYDRSFSLKARLLTEQYGFADVSVGVRDLLGTGIYSSEYIVASKHVGPFDLTAGLGWGRLSDTAELSNPFGAIFPSFKTRSDPEAASTGGAFNFKQYFRGPNTGLFGGIVWHTPIEGLSLIAEYSSDKYVRERAQAPKSFPVRSPVNLGVSYVLSDALSASAGWFYGSSYGVTLTFSGDVTKPNHEARIGPIVPPVSVRNDQQQRESLNVLMRRYHSGSETRALWTPTPRERAVMSLQQVLLSGGRGVRNVDVEGSTLMIEAHMRPDAQNQCAEYARIASNAGTSATSIAMSDFSDGSDQVVFCKVASNTTQPTPVRGGTVNQKSLERKIETALKEQGLKLDAVSAADGELWLYYQNGRYFHESEALGRILRILMRDAPPNVELFHVFPVLQGRAVQDVTVSRSGLERVAQTSGSATELGEAISIKGAALDQPVLERASSKIYPRLTWALGPQIGEQLFDPNEPFQLMVFMEGTANLQLTPGLSLGTTLTSVLWSNYRFSTAAGSTLPHVRTDQARYQDEGQHGIQYLGASYLSKLAPDVFAEVKAGYLEDMFAGVGGQILWRPSGSRFAVGADLYQVWQRDFNRLFGLRPYHVLTGHVSVYYESPWHDINLAVHAGRYLAGDYGATIEVTRRFSTGVEVGAFATFTNVPFSTFGEGSFDKGIIIRIPLEWGLPFFTTTSYNLNLRSLTRDGGQRLQLDDSLYQNTRRTSYNEISEHLEELVRP